MIKHTRFSVEALALCIISSSFAFAALQNLTVDDAATSGAVVPSYLSPSYWNQGNNCSVCLVWPNASLALDGTWHNGRFNPNATPPTDTIQGFEFNFVGSGLYIFFILANTIPNVDITTFTNVDFYLDGTQVSSFYHSPSTSTDFEYNQAVFSNDSIPYGPHNMRVAPINDSVTSVLILFDYLVYTTEVNQGPNVGAIVGGTVGGVAALVLVIASAICYRRHKRRTAKPTPPVMSAVEPFIPAHEMALTPTAGALLLRAQRESLADEPSSRLKPNAPSAIEPEESSSSPGSLSNSGATEILERVEMLRDEVLRLRRTEGRAELESGPPPEYSSWPLDDTTSTMQ